MNKFFILVSLSLSFTVFAETEKTSIETVTPALQKIGESIASQNFMRADFVQKKEIAALNRTLISTGELLFSRDAGIIWKMVEPISQTIVMPTNGGISIFYENKKFENGGGSDMFGGGFSKTMHGLFSGEFDKMLAVFYLQFEESENGWKLTLKPKRRQMQRMMSAIILEGNSGGEVTRFIISSTGGSDTNIEFKNHRRTPKLTPNERLQLGLKK